GQPRDHPGVAPAGPRELRHRRADARLRADDGAGYRAGLSGPAREARFSDSSGVAHAPHRCRGEGGALTHREDLAMTEGTMARRGNKLRIVAWGLAAALWLTPLVAMQFTREVDWDVFDFVVFGAMLLFALGCYEIVSRMSPNRSYRA